MFQNFLPTSGGSGGGGSPPTPPSKIPIQATIIYDGFQTYSDTEIYYMSSDRSFTLKSLSVEMEFSRTAGQLVFQLKKNGTAMVGATVTINGTDTVLAQVDNLSLPVLENDRLSLHLTATGYTPLSNSGLMSLLIQ